jgi:hypothetical protein
MATRHPAGAEWVHVRPLRRPRAPGKQPATSAHANPQEAVPRSDHRPPLAGLKLVRPRPRLPARRCGRSSLAPDRRGSTNRQRRGKATTKVHPHPGGKRTGHRVNSVRPLDNWGPHGCGHSRLDAVPEAYHNPAAVWWGVFAPSPVMSPWPRRSPSRPILLGQGHPSRLSSSLFAACTSCGGLVLAAAGTLGLRAGSSG